MKKIWYELSQDGRHGTRTTLGVRADTIAQARIEAAAAAKRYETDVMIERVTNRGNSTVIERVKVAQ